MWGRQIFAEKDTGNNMLKAIARKMEQIFMPKSMFNNPPLRAKMQEDFKCYISYADILKYTSIAAFIHEASQQYNTQNEKELSFILMEAIRLHSKNLWVNFKGVRPIKPYSLKELTPLYFSQFDTSNNCQDFQTLLEQQTNILNVTYHQEQGLAIVYAEQPEALLELNGHLWYDKHKEYPTDILDFVDYESDQNSQEKKQRLKRQIRVQRQEQYKKSEQWSQNMTAANRFNSIYKTTIDKIHPCIEQIKVVRKHPIKRSSEMPCNKAEIQSQEKPIGLVDFSETNRKYIQVRQGKGHFQVILSKSRYDTALSSDISSQND